MEINYTKLLLLLSTGGLMLQNHTWSIDEDNKTILSVDCVSTSGKKVDTKWGASYKGFSVKAKSLEGLVQEIWERATKEIVLIGRYGNYTHITEWLPQEWGFRNRELADAEKFEYNFSL